jgi:hypothetical protein
MHDPAIEQEKRRQYRIDREGYNRLSRGQRNNVRRITNGVIASRKVAVGLGRAAVGVAEMVINIVLRLPYTLAAKAIARTAKGIVGLLKASVGGVAAVKRGVFASRQGGLKLAAAAVEFLRKKKIISPVTGTRVMRSLAARRDELLARALQTRSWAINRKQQIDHAWEDAKIKMKKAKDASVAFLEYYGALGLYKGTSWILNPRTPSGAPLFGNERANKAVGMIAASGLFVSLAATISKLGLMAKIAQFKMAKSFATDPSPLATKLLKQAAFHPLVMSAVTSMKFFGLPVIAATRRVLKSTDFTQGIGYKYNRRLNALEHLQARREFSANAAPEPASLRTAWDAVKGIVRQHSLAFVEKFVSHVVEKASPAFYEARIRHYDAIKTPPPAPPKDMPRLDI